jgi:hypothetical protein
MAAAAAAPLKAELDFARKLFEGATTVDEYAAAARAAAQIAFQATKICHRQARERREQFSGQEVGSGVVDGRMVGAKP